MHCPISGQPCHNNKQIHLTQIINAEKFEGLVCVECPMVKTPFGNILTQAVHIESQIIALPLMTPENIVLSWFEKIFNNQLTQQSSVSCTGCNMSLEEICRAGRLGCPKCYESFQNHLIPVLERTQGGNLQHLGKVPKNVATFRHHNIEDLKEKLKIAITNENFEDAAVLRDTIKHIEDQIKKEDLLYQQDQNPNNLDS